MRNGLWRKSSEGEMVFIELARRFIVHFMIFEFSFLCLCVCFVVCSQFLIFFFFFLLGLSVSDIRIVG